MTVVSCQKSAFRGQKSDIRSPTYVRYSPTSDL